MTDRLSLAGWSLVRRFRRPDNPLALFDFPRVARATAVPAPLGASRHLPTSLFAGGAGLLVVLVLSVIWMRRKHRPTRTSLASVRRVREPTAGQ